MLTEQLSSYLTIHHPKRANKEKTSYSQDACFRAMKKQMISRLFLNFAQMVSIQHCPSSLLS